MSSYKIISHRGWELPAELYNLIQAKWKRSLRHGNDYFKLCDPGAFYAVYNQLIHKTLSHPTCVVRFAVLADDPDVVLGFSVARGKILDYIHVHKDQRLQGIGKELIPPDITTISHLTRTALTIWGSKYGHWSFNPFA